MSIQKVSLIPFISHKIYTQKMTGISPVIPLIIFWLHHLIIQLQIGYFIPSAYTESPSPYTPS